MKTLSICISTIYIMVTFFFFFYIGLACNYTWHSYIFKLPTLCDLLWTSYSMNIINLLPLCIQKFMFWLKSINKYFSLFVNCNQGKLTIWRLYMVYAGFSSNLWEGTRELFSLDFYFSEVFFFPFIVFYCWWCYKNHQWAAQSYPLKESPAQ